MIKYHPLSPPKPPTEGPDVSNLFTVPRSALRLTSEHGADLYPEDHVVSPDMHSDETGDERGVVLRLLAVNQAAAVDDSEAPWWTKSTFLARSALLSEKSGARAES